jgi:hypothetical protein
MLNRECAFGASHYIRLEPELFKLVRSRLVFPKCLYCGLVLVVNLKIINTK